MHNAFYAGLIDSDGCLSVSHPKRTAVITFTNNDPRLVQLFADRFDGSVGMSGARAHRWTSRAPGRDLLLNAIEPYLITKRDQAALFRQYIEQRTEELADQIKQLKRDYDALPITHTYTDEEWDNYLAGLLEGDGSFTIEPNKKSYRAHVSLASYDTTLREYIAQREGGTTTSTYWRLYQPADLLVRIIQYLESYKREQARLVSLFHIGLVTVPFRSSLPESERTRRRELYETYRSLKSVASRR